eukprot:s1641_g3.t1
MDVDDEATAANSGHPANLLQVSFQEVTAEAQMASLFGEDVPVAELLRQEGSMLASGRVDARASAPYFCPVPGCSRNAARDTSGFASTSTLRAHVDLHMSGELSERPSEEWLTSQGLAACRCCGLSISRRIRDSTHPRCRDAAQSVRSVPVVGEGSAVTDMRLPALHEIFLCNVLTKEYLPASLLPLARQEYGKVIARVLQYNRADAWNTDMDTDAHQKARRAWLEFFMFGKCVLRQSQRGRRPAQAYRFTESLLYRWRAGDRYGLWTEAMVASERRSRGRRREGRVDDVHREVERLVSLGRVGEATRRLVSPALASETPAVKARLLAKFPERDEAEMVSASCVEPPEIPLETVYAAIFSFRKGAGPGPDGIRGDFLRDMLGQRPDEEPIAKLFRDLVQLLADGKAPEYLRPFFGGGKLVGGGKKDGNGNLTLEADARPIVLGLTWHKVVFKATFSLDRSRIQARLGDTQLALTKSGVEIMVHATRAWAQQNRGNLNAVLLQKDVRNAFNEVRLLEFLRYCRDHAPASSRFAQYIYGTSSLLVYSGGLEACPRGQQGCPMMGPMFCLTRRRMHEEARSRTEHPPPEFEVEFADDAYSGGHVTDVWAAFK